MIGTVARGRLASAASGLAAAAVIAFASAGSVAPAQETTVAAEAIDAGDPVAEGGSDDAAVLSEEAAPAAGAAAVRRACDTNSSELENNVFFTSSAVHGAVGPNNFIVVTNSRIGVYRKSNCALISRLALRQLFSKFNVSEDQNVFSPRVLYDRESQRFFVTALSRSKGATITAQDQYFAVSKTSAGTSWHVYRLEISDGATEFFCKRGVDGFLASPNAGQNRHRWFITWNDLRPDATRTGAILTIDKDPTLTGAEATVKCFNNLQVNIAPPIVLDDNDTGFFLSPGSASGDRIKRFAVHTSGGKPKNDTLATTPSIKVTAWTAAPDAPQPNGQKLSTGDGSFVSPSTQIGKSLWNVHTIKVGNFARWRLYEFSTTGTTPLFQINPSTVADKNDHLFNASVATNSAAAGTPAFVTFSRTIPSKGSGRAAMLVAKGPNASASGWKAMLVSTSSHQFVESAVLGVSCSASASGVCFWGPTSATVIDPSNTTGAWGFNELAVGSKNRDWATQAARVN